MKSPSSMKESFIGELFVIATGIAALIHSTWAVATLFSGNEPTSGWLDKLSWVIPGLLVAFALDIGQIVTSHEIREAKIRGRDPKIKYVTFGVFALATYYLQWLYMIHHVPMLSLGEGVSAANVALAQALRDSSVWVVPAFLPLSTLLYTLSGIKTETAEAPQHHVVEVIHKNEEMIQVARDDQPQLPERSSSRRQVKGTIKDYIKANPDKRAPDIAEDLDVGLSTVYRIMKEMNQDA